MIVADEVGRLGLYPVGTPGSQARGALAELVTTAAQGLFENQAVLGLGVIRDVPEALVLALKERAAANGRSRSCAMIE